MSIFDRDCDWYCDECEAHLNRQSGFTAEFGTWTCEKCGCENDVSDNNILSGESLRLRIEYKELTKCPICGGNCYNAEEDYGHPVLVCEDCGYEEDF